jgi:ATP-binding cassette subfamily C protein
LESKRQIVGLAKGLFEFGAGKAAFAIALMIVAGLVEGVSLALLVPLFTVLMGAEESQFLTRMFALALPAGASTTAKLGLVLILFIVAMVLRTCVVTLRDRRVGLIELEYSESLRVRLFQSLARARWQDIEGLKHARVTHALGTGMERVSNATQLLLLASVSLAMLGAQWLITFLIAPKVALIFLLIAAIGAVPLGRLLTGSFRLGDEISGGGISLAHTASQWLGGLKLSIAQNMQHAFVEEYSHLAREQTTRSYAFLRRLSSAYATLTLAAALAAAALLFAGHVLGTPVAALLATFAIFARMNAAAVTFIQASAQLASNAPAHGELLALFREFEGNRRIVSKPKETLSALETVELIGATVGQDPDGRLSDLTLVIQAGETLGITGPSGAGKTTLVDVVAGLIAPDSGVIRINGKSMDDGLAQAWRDRISYVPQESFLLNETVRRNLVWGGKGIADEALWEVLSLVCLDDVVRRTAQGLDTEVSERGIRFSGGERQRIALARAILRRPEALILDEATSAIDIGTESEIFARLAAVRPDLTIVVVAHRPSTLAMCDRIVRLETGQLVEDSEEPAPQAFRPIVERASANDRP